MIPAIEGHINLFLASIGLTDPNLESLAVERAYICRTCPFVSENRKKCTKCGCALAAKIRSSSFCPLDKW